MLNAASQDPKQLREDKFLFMQLAVKRMKQFHSPFEVEALGHAWFIWNSAITSSCWSYLSLPLSPSNGRALPQVMTPGILPTPPQTELIKRPLGTPTQRWGSSETGEEELESSCGTGADGHSKSGAGCITSHFFLLVLIFREMQVLQRKTALPLSVIWKFPATPSLSKEVTHIINIWNSLPQGVMMGH